jgi:hypothetical protein
MRAELLDPVSELVAAAAFKVARRIFRGFVRCTSTTPSFMSDAN